MPQLPIAKTVLDAYRGVFARLPALLAVAWPWLVALIVAKVAGSELLSIDALRFLHIAVDVVLTPVATASVGIAWLRLTLLDEAPRARLGGRELRFMWKSFAISAILGLPFMPL